jgi:cell wall-associated NlpC family hydrolase
MSYRAVRRFGRRIVPAEARAGDVVLINHAGVSTHFGLYVGPGLIHACRQVGRVVEHGDIAVGRAVAYYRLYCVREAE